MRKGHPILSSHDTHSNTIHTINRRDSYDNASQGNKLSFAPTDMADSVWLAKNSHQVPQRIVRPRVTREIEYEETSSELDSDSYEWISDNDESKLNNLRVRDVEHGKFAHIGEPQRGRDIRPNSPQQRTVRLRGSSHYLREPSRKAHGASLSSPFPVKSYPHIAGPPGHSNSSALPDFGSTDNSRSVRWSLPPVPIPQHESDTTQPLVPQPLSQPKPARPNRSAFAPAPPSSFTGGPVCPSFGSPKSRMHPHPPRSFHSHMNHSPSQHPPALPAQTGPTSPKPHTAGLQATHRRPKTPTAQHRQLFPSRPTRVVSARDSMEFYPDRKVFHKHPEPGRCGISHSPGPSDRRRGLSIYRRDPVRRPHDSSVGSSSEDEILASLAPFHLMHGPDLEIRCNFSDIQRSDPPQPVMRQLPSLEIRIVTPPAPDRVTASTGRQQHPSSHASASTPRLPQTPTSQSRSSLQALSRICGTHSPHPCPPSPKQHPCIFVAKASPGTLNLQSRRPLPARRQDMSTPTVMPGNRKTLAGRTETRYNT